MTLENVFDGPNFCKNAVIAVFMKEKKKKKGIKNKHKKNKNDWRNHEEINWDVVYYLLIFVWHNDISTGRRVNT